MSTTELSNFVYTLNNYSEEDINNIQTSPLWTYTCYGKEVSKTGTPHLQGYMELKRRKRLSALKKLDTFKQMHIERRKGTQTEAINYCKKEGFFFEFGTRKIQGKRNDLSAIREMIQEDDASLRKIFEHASNYQSLKAAQILMPLYEKKRNWKPEIWWISGNTGIGKTWLGMQLLGGDIDNIYIKGDTSKWWPNYDAHENVLMDDFRAGWMPLCELLTLLDRYPRMIEFKGGFRQFVPRKIVITSINSPRQTYSTTGEDMEQLIRRIDHEWYFESEEEIIQNAPTIENEESSSFDILFSDSHNEDEQEAAQGISLLSDEKSEA